MLTCCAKLAKRPKAPDVRLNTGWLLVVAVVSTIISGVWEFVGGIEIPSLCSLGVLPPAILLWLLFLEVFLSCSLIVLQVNRDMVNFKC